MKYVLLLVRLLGIILGFCLFSYFLDSLFIHPGVYDKIPLFVFAVFLIIPYRIIKHKYIYYISLSALCLLVIGLIYAFYLDLNSYTLSYPGVVTFWIRTKMPIYVVFFTVLLFNIWILHKTVSLKIKDSKKQPSVVLKRKY